MKTKKIISTMLLCALGLAMLAACTEKPEAESGTPQSDPNAEKYAVINVRDFGEIKVELHPEYAPNTTARFIENVRSDFYTGKNFHRVMADFMIQGGSFDGNGASDPTVQGVKTEVHPDAKHYYGAFCLAANQLGEGSDSFYIVNNKNPNVLDEYLARVQAELDDLAENDEMYRAIYGDEAIDMALVELEARLNVPDDVREKYSAGGTPQLDGNYTVFGYTVDGFDVIDAISAVPVVANEVGEMSKPVDEIIIEWIVLTDRLD